MSEWTASVRSVAVKLSVAILLVLLVWNVRTIVRNQRTYPLYDRPAVRPRHIANIARLNTWDQISATYRWYYQMRALGRGTTVVVPSEMVGHKFYLEEISRLRMEEATQSLQVDGDTIASFIPTDKGLIDSQRLCLMLIDPKATRYYVVYTPDFTTYAVVPEAKFRELLARMGRAQ